MANSVASPEQRAEARRLHETEGWSHRRIAQHFGVQPSTIGRWAKQDAWTPADHSGHRVPTETALAEAAARAEAASLAARSRWAIRRADEADEAGQDVREVRAAIMGAVKAGKASDARQYAIVYGVMIDKATLLSGDERARTNRGEEPNLPPAERPTDPAEMAAAGRARALQLVRPPAVTVESREA